MGAEVLPVTHPLELEALRAADCLVVGPETGLPAQISDLQRSGLAVVQLFRSSEPTPTVAGVARADIASAAEIRLAVHAATQEHRLHELYAEISGAWAHDARGALGVIRLALELVKAGGEPTNPVQKMENGLTRLSWLLERLPTQMALALDLPLEERTAPGTFPSVEAYVRHLQVVHARRPIELLGSDWAKREASQSLVPFAAGFAELAFRISPARARVRFSAEKERCLEVECECPVRPEPWNVEEHLGALELGWRHEVAPYRLVEAARLATRLDISFGVDLTSQGFVARVAAREHA